MPSELSMPDAVHNDWNRLSDELQLFVAETALQQAAETLAQQAEAIAREMEAGSLSDRGGPDALRLFAAVARIGNGQPFEAVGHA